MAEREEQIDYEFISKTSKKSLSTLSMLKGNMLIILICRCIWQFSTAIPRPYLSLYVLALGGDAGTVGQVYALSSIAGIFFYPVGGYIADHQGRVKLVGAATYLYAASFLLFVFAWDWTILAFASFLQNLVLFYVPALYALTADSVPKERSGTGFALLLAIPGALGIVGPYIGGYLISIYGLTFALRVCYVIGFIAGIIVATLRTFTLKETLFTTSQTASFKQFPRLIKESYESFWTTLKWMPQSLRSLAIMQIAKVSLVYISGPFWVLYATEVLGITPFEWGQIALISGAIRFAVAIPAGKFIDKYGAKKILVGLLTLTPILSIAFLYSNSFVQALTVLSFIEIFNAFTIPAFQSMMTGLIPKEKRGRVLAALGIGNFYVDTRGVAIGHGALLFAPGMLAFILGGILYEVNATYPFIFMTFGSVVNAIIALKLLPSEKES